MMKYFLYIAFIANLFSCNQKPDSLSIVDYLSFLNNPENGLVKEKNINGINITVKHLPINYLAYKDLKKGGGKNEYDSLKNNYSNSYTFLLNIEADKKSITGESSNILYKDVNTMEEYKQRAISMNFSMKDFIKITNDDGEIEPVLATMENTYGLATGCSIYVVFSAQDLQRLLSDDKDFNFRFEDDFFQTGISYFTFNEKNIVELPSLVIDNNTIN